MGRLENKAIRAFEAHKQSVDDISTQNDGYLWTSHATDIVKNYIGKDTSLFDTTYRFAFNETYVQEDGKVRAKKLMNSCIAYVKSNGAYKERKITILSKIGDEAAVAAIIALFGAGFYCGNYSASNKVDKEKIQLEMEVEKLKKSILVPFSPPAKLDTNIKEKSRNKTTK